jgi:ketosteroid isomerase-like protein
MTKNPEAIALAYLNAVSTKELDQLDAIVSPDVHFVGPARTMNGRDSLIAALRRISAIHVRNDIKRVFIDGNEVCVIYDLVTDTIGALPTIEWLKIADGRIQSIRLYYDQLPWQRAQEELSRRANANASA